MADNQCPEGYVFVKTCGCGSGKCVPAGQQQASANVDAAAAAFAAPGANPR